MFTSIKTSEANKIIVTELTRKLGLGPENIVARIALAYSLANQNSLKLNQIQDSKGKEYSKNVLFGHYYKYYISLICQKYKLYKTDKDIPKYVKMHIDDGLLLLSKEFNRRKNITGLDFMLSLLEKGMENLKI